MAHHMLVPAVYHSAIRLMLVKGPRLVLRLAPHTTAWAGGSHRRTFLRAAGRRLRLQMSGSWDGGSV